MDNQKVGDFIRNLRKEKNLTQKDLANKLNITDRAVSKWERGLNCPDISLLDDLSNILEVSVIEILKGKKLSKSEIISNKELIETMTFTSTNLKNKIKKIIDITVVSIISFIAILLVFYNIQGLYYGHKAYKINSSEELDLNVYKDLISKNIDLISKNQGKYNNLEYKLILEFTNDIKKLMNKKIEEELLNKKEFKINDFNNFFNNLSIYDIYGYDGINKYKDIYKTILKYDIEKYDQALRYFQIQKYYLIGYESLSEIYEPIYKYGYKLSKHKMYESYIPNNIKMKYASYLIITNDIVEVGGINA